MKRILIVALLALACCGLLAVNAHAATASTVKIYLNPGHGSWGPNDRPMATIPYPMLKSTGRPDTCGFYESNTNLWKILTLRKTLINMGVKSSNIRLSRWKNGPYPYNGTNYTYNKKLSTICAEVNSFGADMFLSVHSNAGSEGSTTNFPILLYRGTDSSEKVKGSKKMAQTILPYVSPGVNEIDPMQSKTSSVMIRGDISFYHSTSTTGYLGVLKHSSPGFLCEGYFHTYQPARHRALNSDYCGQEGVRYARGIRDYFGLKAETTGYIMGTVKSATKKMSNSLYKYASGSIDQWVPLNGAKVTLYKGDTRVATYTVDKNYNGVFVFSGLAPGSDYTLSVSAAGYASPAKTKYSVTANKTTYIKLLLQPGSGTADPDPDPEPDPDPDPQPGKGVTGIMQVWKNTAVPAAADARQGFGSNDKFYVQNKADKKIHIYGKSGDTGTAYDSGAGTNLTRDDVGNLIVRTDGFAGSKFDEAASNLRIISADGSTVKDLTLKGVPAGRCDFFGFASGDVLSDEGGKFYISPAGSSLYLTSISNGEFDDDLSSTATATGFSVANTSTTIINGYDDAEGDAHAVYVPRTSMPSYLSYNSSNTGFTGKTLTLPNYEHSNGMQPFTLGGENFVVYPYDPSSTTTKAAAKYLDGFAVAKIGSDGTATIVAKQAPTATAKANNYQANWLNVEPVTGASNQIYIYQYYPGGYFAKYLFYYQTATVPDLTPTLKVASTAMSLSASLGSSATQGGTVTGSNLTDEVKLALTDANGVFALSTTTIPASQVPTAGTARNFAVTFTPKAQSAYSGTLTVSSKGAKSVTVTLKGTVNADGQTTLTLSPADENYVTATSFRADWTAPANVQTYTLQVSKHQSSVTPDPDPQPDPEDDEGGIAFVPGTDLGSNASGSQADQVTKSGVTLATTSGALKANPYRLDAGSTLTVSSTAGNIAKVKVYYTNNNYAAFTWTAGGEWLRYADTAVFTAKSAKATTSIKAGSDAVNVTRVVVTLAEATAPVTHTQTVTLDPTKLKGTHTGLDTNTQTDKVTQGDVTLAVVKGALGNGSVYKFYKDGTLTLSTAQGTISKIVITTNSTHPAKGLTAATGWTISGNTATFTGNAAQAKLTANAWTEATKVTVTYSYTTAAAPALAKAPVETGDTASRTITGITATSYVVEGLNPQQTYDFKVQATYTNGAVSGWSNVQTVTLKEAPKTLKGDVNLDNQINSGDVSTLVAYMLGFDPSPCDTAACDVNGDGQVNSGDVTALVALILNK